MKYVCIFANLFTSKCSKMNVCYDSIYCWTCNKERKKLPIPISSAKMRNEKRRNEKDTELKLRFASGFNFNLSYGLKPEVVTIYTIYRRSIFQVEWLNSANLSSL